MTARELAVIEAIAARGGIRTSRRRSRMGDAAFVSFSDADQDGKASTPQAEGKDQMDMSKYMEDVFLKVDDVKSSGWARVRIIDVSEGLFGKPYLTFDDGTQLSLSAFNCRVLARAYGMESDNWLGKTLRLGVNEFQYQDKLQDIILVTPLSPPIENKVPPKPKFDEAPF